MGVQAVLGPIEKSFNEIGHTADHDKNGKLDSDEASKVANESFKAAAIADGFAPLLADAFANRMTAMNAETFSSVYDLAPRKQTVPTKASKVVEALATQVASARLNEADYDRFAKLVKIDPKQAKAAPEHLKALIGCMQRGESYSRAQDTVHATLNAAFRAARAEENGGGPLRPGQDFARLPITDDASQQWYPALSMAQERARELGLGSVRATPGPVARGVGAFNAAGSQLAPPVSAIQLQILEVQDRDSNVWHQLGTISLQGESHLTELKSKEELFAEIAAKLNAHVAKQSSKR